MHADAADEQPAEDDDQEVTIVVRRNGPYRVFGKVKLVDQDGNEFPLPDKPFLPLCRCGQSQKRPFCDGNHKQCGFEGEEDAQWHHDRMDIQE